MLDCEVAESHLEAELHGFSPSLSTQIGTGKSFFFFFLIEVDVALWLMRV